MVENAICRIFGRGSRRVIIPGMGALIKRDNGEVIFTDMLRRDDGELVSSVVCTFGISEEKAREIVAHYASGLKSELRNRGFVEINGIGVLSVGPHGKYSLKPAGAADSPLHALEEYRAIEESEASEEGKNAEGMSSSEAGNGLSAAETKSAALTEEAECDETEPMPQSVEDAAPQAALCEGTEDAWAGAEESVGAAESEDGRETLSEMPGEPGESASDNTLFQRNHRADKSRLRRALYGEEDREEDAPADGEGVRNGETNTERAAATSAIGGESANAGYAPGIEIRRPHKPKKRVDGVLIIAIIAVVITLGVLAYGYFTKLNIERAGGEDIIIELNVAGEGEAPSAESVE